MSVMGSYLVASHTGGSSGVVHSTRCRLSFGVILTLTIVRLLSLLSLRPKYENGGPSKKTGLGGVAPLPRPLTSVVEGVFLPVPCSILSSESSDPFPFSLVNRSDFPRKHAASQKRPPVGYDITPKTHPVAVIFRKVACPTRRWCYTSVCDNLSFHTSRRNPLSSAGTFL